MLMSEPQHPQRRATPLMVVRTVLSAFVGIRRSASHERDAVTITPLQAIIAGLVGAALFVTALLTVVWFVTH